MATRKVKKLADGFDKGEFEGVDEAVEKQASEPARKPSFKEAFAAANKGDVFEWNGKQYKKEFASEKKAATPAAAVKEVKDDIKAQESVNAAAEKAAPRVGRASQAVASGVNRPTPTAEGIAAANEKRAQQRASMGDVPFVRALRALRARGESGPPAYAKGGVTKSKSASSRGDGIAQRGKTRGTMVACGGGYMKGKK